MRLSSLLVVALLLVTFSNAHAEPDGDAQRSFGAPITLDRPVALAELLKTPERYADTPVLVTGRIVDVCQRKGCWTVLRDGESSMRVRFQDYGFFLPKDCHGEQARVEGRVVIRTLSEAEARHYAEESSEGDPSRVLGPQRDVGFLATGVELSGAS